MYRQDSVIYEITSNKIYASIRLKKRIQKITLHTELTSLANNKLLNNDSRIFALCFLKPRRGNPHIEDWLEIYVTKYWRIYIMSFYRIIFKIQIDQRW